MTPEPRQSEGATAIMDSVDQRVLAFANPCPSRDEWDRLRAHVQRQENVIAAMAHSVPHTFGALTDMAIEIASLARTP